MIEFIKNNSLISKCIYSILVIIISVVMYKLFIKIMKNMFSKNKKFYNKRTNTYINLFMSIIRYIFIVIVLMIILKINGVNVSSVLAGIGIVGIVIGLAIQDFLKDIIRGSSILSDNYFSVGDIIKYNNIEGKVLAVGLKTTKIQELATSNIYSIANRKIEMVALISKIIYVKVPLPYELKLKEQHKVIDDIVSIIKKDSLIKNCENVGLTELADSRIEYLLKVTLDPVNKLQVRRNTLEHIIEGLEKNNITVPYNQLDIHEKKQ